MNRRDFASLLSLTLAAVAVAPSSGCKREKPPEAQRPLAISAIPDQDPEKLQRLYGGLAAYLSKQLGAPVVYKPVTDYKAAVTAFKVGDLDLVWFGGLTGVQARLQVPGAEAIAQRDIDEKFRSVFIATPASGIKTLGDLKGHTFTFGSESSTSGRLMPQFFLDQAGLALDAFKGKPGFSGSHDKTVELVSAGSFDAGVVNEQVWKKRVDNKTADPARVQAFYTTPPYHDYHWVLHPEASKKMGFDVKAKFVGAVAALSASDPEQAKILDLFGAKQFIATSDSNYGEIEKVGRSIGLIVGSGPEATAAK